MSLKSVSLLLVLEINTLRKQLRRVLGLALKTALHLSLSEVLPSEAGSTRNIRLLQQIQTSAFSQCCCVLDTNCLTNLTHNIHKVDYMAHAPRIQDFRGSDGQMNIQISQIHTESQSHLVGRDL